MTGAAPAVANVVTSARWEAIPVAPSLLGESPFWHPDESALYWCDIPGKKLHRWHPASQAHQDWSFDTEPGCCAPLVGGDLLLAMRDGLFRFNPNNNVRKELVAAPYAQATERFNDGKADPQGRLWVGTIYEPRQPANASLYRWSHGALKEMAGDITVSNGLAFSPDGRTMYWADTQAHRIMAFDFDAQQGTLSGQRSFAQFPVKTADQDLATYGGRPDGAAVDVQGAYWVAMYEGQRVLRFAADGRLLQDIALPVRCPTMPCLGGPDLRTLYVTTARTNRPADELAAQPLAGCVLSLRVDVPGLPVNFAAA
jgi:sugar lactone lactonase YvrE